MNNWENKFNSLEEELRRLRETSVNIRSNINEMNSLTNNDEQKKINKGGLIVDSISKIYDKRKFKIL